MKSTKKLALGSLENLHKTQCQKSYHEWIFVRSSMVKLYQPSFTVPTEEHLIVKLDTSITLFQLHTCIINKEHHRFIKSVIFISNTDYLHLLSATLEWKLLWQVNEMRFSKSKLCKISILTSTLFHGAKVDLLYTKNMHVTIISMKSPNTLSTLNLPSNYAKLEQIYNCLGLKYQTHDTDQVTRANLFSN